MTLWILEGLIEQDTILISYHIAYFGESGGVDEGIILFKDVGVLKAMYVRYNGDNYINSSFNWNDHNREWYETQATEWQNDILATMTLEL